MCVRMTQSSALPPTLARSVPNHITSLIKLFSLWSYHHCVTSTIHGLHPLLSLSLYVPQYISDLYSISECRHTIKHMLVWLLLSVNHADKRISSEWADWVTYAQGWQTLPKLWKLILRAADASLGSSLTICAQMFALSNAIALLNWITHTCIHLHGRVSWNFSCKQLYCHFQKASVWVVFS